jgi:hypothetical protein
MLKGIQVYVESAVSVFLAHSPQRKALLDYENEFSSIEN